MTVRDLIEALEELERKGHGDKCVLIHDGQFVEGASIEDVNSTLWGTVCRLHTRFEE